MPCLSGNRRSHRWGGHSRGGEGYLEGRGIRARGLAFISSIVGVAVSLVVMGGVISMVAMAAVFELEAPPGGWVCVGAAVVLPAVVAGTGIWCAGKCLRVY